MRLKTMMILALTALQGFALNPDPLWDSFISPSQEARTKLWWFHGETVTTREGIDADLQAFKDAGIGGVVFYDQCHGKQEGALASMSPEWWEMLKYAATKAKELGLSFEMASTNGYVAGGPWITPELGMQKVVALRPGDPDPKGFQPLARISIPKPNDPLLTDTLIQSERITLLDNEPVMLIVDFGTPKEFRTISYSSTPRGKGSYGSMNIPGAPAEDYFGAMYVMLPPIGTLESSDDGKTWSKVCDLRGVEDVIGHKSRQRTVNFPPAKARFFRVNIHDWIGGLPEKRRLDVEGVRLMSYDLLDNWEEKSGLRSEVERSGYPEPPKGEFLPFFGEMTIGFAPTGGASKHGRNRILWDGKEISGKGWLEADVLSARAAETHYRSYFKAVHDTLAAIGCAPAGMHIDSHEAGIANWTPEMPAQFKRLRGYDIEPWLPALGGQIVESREATERFLKDFRLTISQLAREEFYATIARLCHEDGVSLTSQAMLGCANDNIASRGAADTPQGEFWGYQKDGNYDTLDAASSAHLYGKKIASGEAFTDSPYFYPEDDSDSEWKERGWHDLLRIANLAYAKGINEFVVCASTYQPWLDHKYDDDASAHPYIFHRLNPAWDKSRDHFWEYQARCSQMLQTGRPVVDLLVFLGDQLPGKTLAYKLPEIPEDYNFDVCTLPSLKAWMESSSDFSPEYLVLAVQDRSDISPEAETLFEALEKRGVQIVRCDKGENLADAIAAAGLKPDFAFVPDLRISSDNSSAGIANLPDRIHFFHRSLPDADIYFLYNHSDAPRTGKINLRSPGKKIEVWDPLTAERHQFPGSLTLAPRHSLFLIAR